MVTLVHEDIYLYIDPVQNEVITIDHDVAAAMTLYNDATEQAVDAGILTLTGESGSISSFTINDEDKTITVNVSIGIGDVVRMDFRNGYYTKNGSQFFLDEVLEVESDSVNVITLSFSGTGVVEVRYEYHRPYMNNDDLMFCTSFDLNEEIENFSRKNIKGETKVIKNGKKTYSVSINGLWNEIEVSKFESETGMFRLRLVDEDGNELDKVSNFIVNSNQKASSDSGDLTYTISGVCEAVFK